MNIHRDRNGLFGNRNLLEDKENVSGNEHLNPRLQDGFKNWSNSVLRSKIQFNSFSVHRIYTSLCFKAGKSQMDTN